MPIIPALWKLRQDWKFKANLGYRARPCPKKKTKQLGMAIHACNLSTWKLRPTRATYWDPVSNKKLWSRLWLEGFHISYKSSFTCSWSTWPLVLHLFICARVFWVSCNSLELSGTALYRVKVALNSWLSNSGITVWITTPSFLCPPFFNFFFSVCGVCADACTLCTHVQRLDLNIKCLLLFCFVSLRRGVFLWAWSCCFSVRLADKWTQWFSCFQPL